MPKKVLPDMEEPVLDAISSGVCYEDVHLFQAFYHKNIRMQVDEFCLTLIFFDLLYRVSGRLTFFVMIFMGV